MEVEVAEMPPDSWARVTRLLPHPPPRAPRLCAVVRHRGGPGGPCPSWSSRAVWGGHGARAGARPPPPPALLSLGSSKQKPLVPGSPCPRALTNVAAKAPAVPVTPHNTQASRLIAAAGRSQDSERLLPWAFSPGSGCAHLTPCPQAFVCLSPGQAPNFDWGPDSALPCVGLVPRGARWLLIGGVS